MAFFDKGCDKGCDKGRDKDPKVTYAARAYVAFGRIWHGNCEHQNEHVAYAKSI
jgi:hypothetical protein